MCFRSSSLWKTLNFLKGAREVKQANFAIAVPYPGTVFHEMASSGKDGIELLTEDFTEYKRYGHAVTNVGSLSSQDLLRLQNEGFVSIYSKPDRWKSVIKKNLSKTNHNAILFFVKKHQKFIQIIPQTIVVFNNFSQQFRIMDG